MKKTLNELIAGESDPSKIAMIAIRFQRRESSRRKIEKHNRKLFEESGCCKKLPYEAMTLLIWEYAMSRQQDVWLWLRSEHKELFPLSINGDGMKNDKD